MRREVKRKMNKLTIVVIVFAMVLTLSACNSNNTLSESLPDSTVSTNPTEVTSKQEKGSLPALEIEDSPAKDFDFKVSDKKVILTKYLGNSKIVKIPDNIDGYPVKELDYATFSGFKREANQAIEQIILPEGIEILGNFAFSHALSLVTVNIPASVTSIGKRVFSNCDKLESIVVSPDNGNYCEIDGVLFNKHITELIAYPAGKKLTIYTVPESVEIIGDCSFWHSMNIKTVVLPNNLEVIESSAFQGSKLLSSIEIPASVKTIGDQAFSHCEELNSVKILSKDTIIGVKPVDDGYIYKKSDSSVGFGLGDMRDHTFLNTDNISIFAPRNSFAEKYAKRNGIQFSPLE